MNNRPIIILAIVVLAIAVGAIWFLQMKPQTATGPGVAEATPVPPPAVESTSRPSTVPGATPIAPPAAAKTAQPKPAVPRAPLADWEVKIDQALRANVSETDTAQMLINMLPTMPPEGQAEAAQHISNLLLDQDYNRVASIVKNPATPEEVLDVFVTDLMNREDPVKLPLLLEIAKIPNHPHHEEAQSDLQIFLDEDYGTDWAKWDAKLKEYLKTQADENAAAEAAAKAAAPRP